jgi:myosin heavy subunit
MTKVTVVDDGKDKQLDLYYDDMHRTNPRVVDDMTSLHEMHEPGILANLEARMALDPPMPYTFVANVLIAVNPLRRIPMPERDDYIGKKITANPPHPYGIAENSFTNLSQSGVLVKSVNQSIVIGGESGAGKTESCKICLRYLTQRANKDASRAGKTDDLDKKLLSSNPILEAYGNAKTHRNPNSSRFGKFMKLQFTDDKKFSLYGASIETYLLEKSRVVFQMKGERNYHIFYQIIKGSTPEERKEMCVEAGCDGFKFLSMSGCTEVPQFDDVAEYGDVLNALKVRES